MTYERPVWIGHFLYPQMAWRTAPVTKDPNFVSFLPTLNVRRSTLLELIVSMGLKSLCTYVDYFLGTSYRLESPIRRGRRLTATLKFTDFGRRLFYGMLQPTIVQFLGSSGNPASCMGATNNISVLVLVGCQFHPFLGNSQVPSFP